MKIKYVGLKLDGETAFSRETGITWMPGMVEEVTGPITSKMLQHPDVFEEVKDDAKTAATAKQVQTLAPGAVVGSTTVTGDSIIQLEDGSKMSLDGKDVDSLRVLAKSLGQTVHPKAGAAKITAALLAAFPVKPE